ncbi:MAG: hypothetical protein KZQ83_12335 [gamma proteobacterium symbiont of Taylorina sp.]|nr:hypothetical protein [gamma proteobacterium symbiont of Taylorina sp.]
MLDKVAFIMDDQEVLSYDRSQILPDNQKEYLDNMDKKMAKGFILVDQSIEQPDFQQRTQFVALNCVNALLQDNDQMAIILFSYLVNRMPDLKQAKAKVTDYQSGKKIGIEFIFDEVKPQGQKIHFQMNAKTH